MGLLIISVHTDNIMLTNIGLCLDAASPKQCMNSVKVACGAVVIVGVLLYSIGPELLPPKWGGRKGNTTTSTQSIDQSSGYVGGGGGGGGGVVSHGDFSDTTERLLHGSGARVRGGLAR